MSQNIFEAISKRVPSSRQSLDRAHMKRLDDDEKSLLLKYMSSLPYRSLDWQTSVLKTFTDETLRVNSSLGGNPLLSANLSSLIKREEAPAPLKDFP